MKVLFAVSNDKMSETIVRQYQRQYKQIISYKNVYYFNAILKELQKDKGYDRIVISEDLEQYVNNNYEQMDNFLFSRLDSISDEASNMNGEDIPIVLICTERRNKAEPILVKLFGIGIYNAIIGNDRSVNEVCRLLNRPRSKKEAKIYYQIDSEDVSYEKDDENDVSELEIQNILAHYKRLGNDEERFVESFDSIASQYNDMQLRVISRCLPLNVRAVLEEKSTKYQQINTFNNKISDQVRMSKKEQEKKGTSEILLKNAKSTNINEPVVVPSAIDTSKKRKIVSTPIQNVQQPIYEEPEENSLPGIDFEEVEEDNFDIEDILATDTEEMSGFEDIPEVEIEEKTELEDISEVNIEEPEIEQIESEQPVKRKRGRPRKIITEPVEQAPKRKRGRPRKVVETVEETILPGLEEEEEIALPGFTENNEEEEEIALPGFSENDEEEIELPGFSENDEEEIELPGFSENEEEEIELPGFENIEENNFQDIENNDIEDEYTNVLKNLKEENEKDEFIPRRQQEEIIEYPELNMDNLLSSKQKIVAFVGTSKNGTSFLINNVAELLSTNGIDTAILDLTHNRNAYYIYTKNEESLRNRSNYIMKNLKDGRAEGIQEHKNLTIYTTAFQDDEDIKSVEPIVETLVRNHTVVLLDCDFTTPMKYFKYVQEIYLVQSMDILTIQPLTEFLNELNYKKMFNPSKVRVILNKFMRTREINEQLLIGGISIYNDSGMTVRRELFDRKSVKYTTIPFELKTYLRYLEGLVVCDVSLKGYSKEFMQSLKELANMVYMQQENKRDNKYMPPSIKNNNTFSPSMNKTLNQMKQNY